MHGYGSLVDVSVAFEIVVSFFPNLIFLELRRSYSQVNDA